MFLPVQLRGDMKRMLQDSGDCELLVDDCMFLNYGLHDPRCFVIVYSRSSCNTFSFLLANFRAKYCIVFPLI